MKHKWIALALAGVLTLSMLTACAPSQGDSTPTPTPTPEDTVTPLPTQPDTETSTPSQEPTQTPEQGDEPTANPNPTVEPTPTPAPTPTAAPTTSSPTPAPAAASVEDIWADMADGAELPDFMDLDEDMLSDLYGIDAGDLEEFLCKIPAMSTQATEFFLAKVKSGCMDSVKAGCERRQGDLAAQWAQYLPEQKDLVDRYQLVTNGDYILFCIAEESDTFVAVFDGLTK